MVLHLIMLAEGQNVIDVANRLTTQTTDVLKNIALLAALGVIVATYVKTRAWVPTLVSVVIAGFVVWAVNNTGFLSDSTNETIRANSQLDVRALVAEDAPQQQAQPGAVAHVAFDREFNRDW